MKADIGLNPDEEVGVSGLLSTLLADEFVLYTKTRNCHWNVVGPLFGPLHKFFQDQYEALDDIFDDVAERIRQLGVAAPATLTQFVAMTRLTEYPSLGDAKGMCTALLGDHESVIKLLRADLVTAQDTFHDAGTCNFMTDLMEKHEKMAWMLRAMVS